MDGMAMPMQKSQEMMEHLNHVTYPATKKDLEEACEKMSDMSDGDKKWFMDNLPDKTFKNADEVRMALGM